MNITTLVIFLILGGLTGWVTGRIIKEDRYGIMGHIFIGSIGGIVGGYLFRLLVFAFGGMLGSMVTAIAGAAALLYFSGTYSKSRQTTQPVSDQPKQDL